MPIKLTAPIVKDFHLEKSDSYLGNEGDPTSVTILQATQMQNERRDALFAEVSRVINVSDRPEEMVLRQRWSNEELKRLEAYLTLVGCNLLDFSGDALFHFKQAGGRPSLDMTEKEFQNAWGRLPPIVAREIHEKVLEVNPTWGGTVGEE